MWKFIEPNNLLFLILPTLIVVSIFLKKKKTTPILLMLTDPKSILKKLSKSTRLVFGLFFLGYLGIFILMAVVFARPMRIKSWIQKWTEGVDIVFALDVSESMEASDLTPSRIIAAKAVIKDFVTHRPDDRIGLVIFGGESILKSPLTRDFDFLLSQVEDVRLRELKQGTAIGNGLANGIARLKQSESKNKILILLTDGDSNVGAINPVTAAHLARQEGIRIYSIGIGQQDRVLVPIYSYDIKGQRGPLLTQIPSYLNPELLKQISAITNGKAYMARDTGMLNRILKDIDAIEKTKIKLLPMSKKEEFFLIPALIATLGLFFLIILQETRFQRRRLNGI
ncbi:MAG: VWA domain-containing protein [Deltaproteobacteria bacterium]|nr:VWA domain-containing protein [Deltaproteobacteria bacterium]